MAHHRRSFLLGLTGIGAASASANGLPRRPFPPGGLASRSETTLAMRENAAVADCLQAIPAQSTNGDETALPGYVGCFTKGLPHDQTGLVEPAAYESLLHAVSTGQHADFEAIDRGSGMKLVNPESSFAFELEGLDSHQVSCPPAPQVSSVQAADEMVELYWQALARDVPLCRRRNLTGHSVGVRGIE